MSIELTEKKKTKQQIAYEAVKEAILTNQVSSSADISERKLCNLLGMSRTPVREAMKQLQNEGLLDIQQGAGSFLNKLSYEDVVEIFQLRAALESLAVELYIHRKADDDELVLKNLLNNMISTYMSSDYELFMDIDQRFHDEIIRGSCNHRLKDIMDKLEDNVKLLRSRIIHDDEVRKDAIESHKQIVNAIVSRDVKGAKARVSEHVKEVERFYTDRYFLLKD